MAAHAPRLNGPTSTSGGVLVGVLVFHAMLLTIGCNNGPASVPLPEFNPTVAGESAVEQHDADGDGALAGDELKNVPGIQRSLSNFDTDNDKRVTVNEIADRLNEIFEHKLGICPAFGCTILLDGRRLVGATVEFVPEEFLGSSSLHALGETDAEGVARVQIPQDLLPDDLRGIRGIQPGIYRVKVTHPRVKVPTRYNEQTELGQEISNETILFRPSDTIYKLSSKE